MYLSRFGVKNYKCLGEIDIPLTPIHVLIGQNDCGKTSLLEAMEAFFATADKPVANIFPEPWEGRELVRHGTSGAIVFSGEWTRQSPQETTTPYLKFQYGLSISFPLVNHHTCIAEKQWIETDGNRRSLEDRGLKIARLEYLKSDHIAVSQALRTAHKYALDAGLMAMPAGFDDSRRFRLDSDGFGLATLLDDILSRDPEIFLSLRNEFCNLFPQFQTVRISTEPAIARTQANGLIKSSQVTGKGIYFVTQSGQEVRARHASDGAVLFLGLLALSHLPEPPSLLLLEEPENGVYPLRLGQIIKLLKEMVIRTEGVRFPQIILTTHSPYVLSFFEPEEVTLLSRDPEKPDAPVRARPLRDAPNIRDRLGSDFYLGELWYNLSEGELFGDEVCQSSH